MCKKKCLNEIEKRIQEVTYGEITIVIKDGNVVFIDTKKRDLVTD